MKSNNKEIKEEIIEALFARGGYIKQVNDVEYRTECPFCSQSDKFYIRINTEDNFPIVYNCFKCNESGVLNNDTLELLGIDDVELKNSVKYLNKTSSNFKSKQFLGNDRVKLFDYKIPKITDFSKIKYIEDRLGVKIGDECEDFKIITDFNDFLKINKIKSVQCSTQVYHDLCKNYIGFLSYGNSHILFRDVTNTSKYRWIKYSISKDSQYNRLFYSISSEIDLFTKEKITINLSEGVMDAIGVYYHMGGNAPNTLNIAVCGKQYDGVIKYLVSTGFIGSNININIYADNDAKYNTNNKAPTDIKYFNKIFYKLKYLFGNIHIYYNILDKDYGVPKEKISVKKIKL